MRHIHLPLSTRIERTFIGHLMSNGMPSHHTFSSSSAPRNAAAHPHIGGPHSRRHHDIFAIVPRHFMASPIDLQATVQRRVLGTINHVLWTRIELRRLGLEGRSLSRLPLPSRLLPFPLYLSNTLFCLTTLSPSQPLL